MSRGCQLMKQPYHESPARQDKGNHKSSILVHSADAHAVAHRSREAADKPLLHLTTSLIFTGQTGREGRGVWCGKVMAQYQIQQTP